MSIEIRMFLRNVIILFITIVIVGCSLDTEEEYYKKVGYELLKKHEYAGSVAHGPSEAIVNLHETYSVLDGNNTPAIEIVISIEFLAKEEYSFNTVKVLIDKKSNELEGISFGYGPVE
ncbi:MAG: hypothetical protein U5K71_10410 [Gracilimonas sp.]|nr:hypothetical protein [Gracilimonas sp.]